MVFLGFGKYVRADKIYALEPLGEGERGHGRRTRVWIEGIPDPIVASRTERTILHDMGHDTAASSPIVDEALDLAERLAEQMEAGRVDLGDLGRRARRLLEASAKPSDERLF
jgi:hypothetical protein